MLLFVYCLEFCFNHPHPPYLCYYWSDIPNPKSEFRNIFILIRFRLPLSAFRFSKHPLSGSNPLQLYLFNLLPPSKPLLRIQDLQSRQPPFRIVIRGDPFGQRLGRNRRLPKHQAQGIHLGVISQFHVLEIVHVDRDHRNFLRFLHENRPHPFSPISLSIPSPLKLKVMLTGPAPLRRCLPGGQSDGRFDLFDREPPNRPIVRRMPG